MGEMTFFLPLIIILGAFMFFASRRQKKAMQATIDLHNSLTVGDRVHTTSGLQGTITGITDDTDDPAEPDYEARESTATEITDSPNRKTDG